MLATLKIWLYSEDIYCEVLPMNVAHLLLGRPWLYDNTVKYCSRNNTYKFTHDKKAILLRPAKSVISTCPVAKSFASNTPIQWLQILTRKYFEKESIDSRFIFALVVVDSFTMPSEPLFTHSLDVSSLWDEFRDTMLDELPDVLPSLRDIQYAIDLVSESQLPTFPIIWWIL